MNDDLEHLPKLSRLGRAHHKWRTQVAPILEKRYPFIIGAVVSFCVWYMGVSQKQYDSLMDAAVPVAVSVAAILAGFQGTIHAILLSMRSSRAITRLKTTGHYSRLMAFVAWSAYSLLGFVVLALALLAIRSLDHDLCDFFGRPAVSPQRGSSNCAVGPSLVAAALAGLFAYAMFASFRIMRLVLLLLAIPDESIRGGRKAE